MVRMAALISGAPALTPKNVDQIAALPLGSRVQVNAWDGTRFLHHPEGGAARRCQ